MTSALTHPIDTSRLMYFHLISHNIQHVAYFRLPRTPQTTKAHIATIQPLSRENTCRVLVVHTYIPIYSGDRDQEERSSNPAWANSFQDPLLEKPLTKRAGGAK
jgi:hypothetical protein